MQKLSTGFVRMFINGRDATLLPAFPALHFPVRDCCNSKLPDIERQLRGALFSLKE